MRLIPYCRVSTEEQAAEGHSVQAQADALTRWAALNGHELTMPQVDAGVSAGKALEKRKAGGVLLAMLRAGKGEGVVVTRLDRLFRDALEGLAFFRRCAESGWVVMSASEALDTSTPAGRLAVAIQLAAAQYERELACVRTQAVTDSLRERGKVYGTVPYGCLSIDGHLLRDPANWPVREMIVEWHRGHRYSLRTIRGMLYDMRITAPAGGARWPLSTLAGLLDSHDTLARLPIWLGEGPLPAPIPDEPEKARVTHPTTAASAAGVH